MPGYREYRGVIVFFSRMTQLSLQQFFLEITLGYFYQQRSPSSQSLGNHNKSTLLEQIKKYTKKPKNKAKNNGQDFKIKQNKRNPSPGESFSAV